MIPLDEDASKVTLRAVSASLKPYPQGWYVGRNDAGVHAAITVSRKVCGVKDFRFRTLLIPVKAGAPVPRIERGDDGVIEVFVGEKKYRVDPSCIRDE